LIIYDQILVETKINIYYNKFIFLKLIEKLYYNYDLKLVNKVCNFYNPNICYKNSSINFFSNIKIIDQFFIIFAQKLNKKSTNDQIKFNNDHSW